MIQAGTVTHSGKRTQLIVVLRRMFLYAPQRSFAGPSLVQCLLGATVRPAKERSLVVQAPGFRCALICDTTAERDEWINAMIAAGASGGESDGDQTPRMCAGPLYLFVLCVGRALG